MFWIVAFTSIALPIINARTTIGYIEPRTTGEVHLLSSFRPTKSEVSVDTEILTSKSDWYVAILDCDNLKVRLEDCKCDCIEKNKIKEEDAVKPVNGVWRISRELENTPSLIAVVLSTCDVKRIHSGDSLIEYAVTFVNGDGTHVSHEEIGERGLIASFLVIYEIGTACFFFSWFRYYKKHGSFETQRNWLLYLFTSSIWMYSMDLTCKYIHMSVYEEDGVGYPTLQYLSMVFRTTSHSLFVLLLIFFPCIYANLSGLQQDQEEGIKTVPIVTDYTTGEKLLQFVHSYLSKDGEEPAFKKAFHLFLASYCVSNLWVSYEVSEQRYHQSRNSESWELLSIFVSIILEISMYLVFAFRSLDVSNQSRHDRGVRDFFQTFIWIFTPLFVSSLLRLFLSLFCEPWSSSLHYANMFWVFVTVLSYAFMGNILWPCSSNWILTDRPSRCSGSAVRGTPFGNMIADKISKWMSSDYHHVEEYDDCDENNGDMYDEIPGGMMAKLDSF